MATKWPYFREYADTWRARLLPRSLEARAFVDGAKRECWGEARGEALTLPLAQWCEALLLTPAQLEAVVQELSGRAWIHLELDRDRDLLTVSFPDLLEQVQSAATEAERGRKRRSGTANSGSALPFSGRPLDVREPFNGRPKDAPSEDGRMDGGIRRTDGAAAGAVSASPEPAGAAPERPSQETPSSAPPPANQHARAAAQLKRELGREPTWIEIGQRLVRDARPPAAPRRVKRIAPLATSDPAEFPSSDPAAVATSCTEAAPSGAAAS